MTTYSPYFLPLPPERKYSQPLKIRPFIQDRGGSHCCNERLIGALSKCQMSSAPGTHPWRIVLQCPMVSLQGPDLRDKLASRESKDGDWGSVGEEEFQEHKEGRCTKVSRCSQLLAEPLFQPLRAKWFMGQPDNGNETWQVGWLDLSSNFHLASSPWGLRWKSVDKNYRKQETLSHLVGQSPFLKL